MIKEHYICQDKFDYASVIKKKKKPKLGGSPKMVEG